MLLDPSHGPYGVGPVPLFGQVVTWSLICPGITSASGRCVHAIRWMPLALPNLAIRLKQGDRAIKLLDGEILPGETVVVSGDLAKGEMQFSHEAEAVAG